MPDNRYTTYELKKKIIAETAKTPKEYEDRIKRLARELGI
jgi:hypothetical protein